MMYVFLVNIFSTKFVHYEVESGGSTFVVPEAVGGEFVIVSCSVELFGEEIVGKLSRLGKAIDTFPNFEMYPPVLCEIMEVVFVDELLRYFSEADTCIFMTIEINYQVKVFSR